MLLKASSASNCESPRMSNELLSGTAAPTTNELFNNLQFAAALFRNLYLCNSHVHVFIFVTCCLLMSIVGVSMSNAFRLDIVIQPH